MEQQKQEPNYLQLFSYFVIYGPCAFETRNLRLGDSLIIITIPWEIPQIPY